jgi:hypothetical protein
MADETPETTAQRDERVRLVEEDRATRRKKSPVTEVLSVFDVLRHLVTGLVGNPAARDELLAVVDDEDPAVKTAKANASAPKGGTTP